MPTYIAVVERCPVTGLYVGHIPGRPGAHSQGATLDELKDNLREVIALLLDEGQERVEDATEFADTICIVTKLVDTDV